MPVTGAKEFQAQLTAMRERAENEAALTAARAGGKVVLEALRTAAPELIKTTAGSDAYPPGTVRRGLRATKPELDAPGLATTTIGPNKRAARPAYLVEYGHRLVKGGKSRISAIGVPEGPGHEVGQVKAHPWARPAAESSASDAQEAAGKSGAKSILEVLHERR